MKREFDPSKPDFLAFDTFCRFKTSISNLFIKQIIKIIYLNSKTNLYHRFVQYETSISNMLDDIAYET